MRIPSPAQKKSLESRSRAYHEQLLNPEGYDLYAWLTEERGLSPEALDHFRLGAVLDPEESDTRMRGRITIPYITPNGTVQMRFRAAPGVETDSKYLGAAGCETTIFNTGTFLERGSWICICEGEVDTISAWQCGVPAVGFAGASQWKRHYKTLFEGYERVVILADNDEPGLKFAEKIAEFLPGPAVVPMPEEGMDVNQLLAEQGPEALRALLKLD